MSDTLPDPHDSEGSVLPVEEREVLRTLVGRTITAAAEVPGEGGPDRSDTGYVRLTLDDGRRVDFGGWGHDYYGPTLCLVDEDSPYPADPPAQVQ